MKINPKSSFGYITIGFIIGFLLSIISIATEDIEHNIPISSALNTWQHFIGPLLIGLCGGIVGFYLYSSKIKKESSLKKLLDTQAKYKTMISNISDVIAVVNMQGIITYKSPNITQHFGWSAEELIGTPYINAVHPEDLKIIEQAHLKTLNSENQTTTVEFRYKCKNGSYKTVLLKAVNLINNPAINGVLMNYHDISDKKEAENNLIRNEYKYRTLFENMSDVVCMLNNKRNIIDVNKAAIDLFGYSKKELLKKNISEFIYTEDKEHSDKYFSKLKTEGFYELYEGRVITKSSKVRWIQVNSTAIKKDGKTIGSQDIVRDISKKKKMELSLRESANQLLELNATKDKFFSIIAHDLKGPFNSMLGFSELLINNIDSYEKKKIERFINLIHGTLEDTFNLLNNLLEWAMSQRGSLSFKLEENKLNELVNEKLSVLDTYANQKNIKLTTTIEENITIKVDKNMFSSIIRNLISNAIKFTPNGGEVNLSALKQKNTIQIIINDNGVGMNDEVKTSLFNMSTNESTKGTNNENGTGLGLILCKEFATKHGGNITVESELGKGSKFVLSLPAK